MQYSEFRETGHYLINYIADYLEKARQRPLFANAQPAFLHDLFNEPIPDQSHSLNDVQKNAGGKIDALLH
jgi:hypothetical protein